jgi:hypothetical protein
MTSNPYQGVNAHLNSFLQAESGGWESFHAQHVTHWCEFLDRYLPQGYYARAEKSLQIVESHALFNESRSWTKPDVTIFRQGTPSSSVQTATATPPSFQLALNNTLYEEETLSSVVIYHTAQQAVFGKPITRIELLSPANKNAHQHKLSYLVKRDQTLQSGLGLVEIDFLHLMSPLVAGVPDYTKKQAESFPYYIFVSHPYPDIYAGKLDVYGCHVNEVLPKISVPLAQGDHIIFDVEAVYQHTLGMSRFFQMAVDYMQVPTQFESYSPQDQATIQRIMQHWAQNVSKTNEGD